MTSKMAKQAAVFFGRTGCCPVSFIKKFLQVIACWPAGQFGSVYWLVHSQSVSYLDPSTGQELSAGTVIPAMVKSEEKPYCKLRSMANLAVSVAPAAAERRQQWRR